ncbi:MAG: leucine-rich repeat protein [Bacteroidales bacterium]|jgi:hypothetical protein|nr:leucine-rich repeat protein [Bacteroidales bacterium]
MKKFVLSFTAIMLLSVMSAFAQDCDYSGTTGPLQWCLKSGTLTISGTGAMPDYWTGSPWYGYRESITSVVIGNSIITIGCYAFEECTALTSVTIPNSVTTIGNYAFNYCTALTSITIPNGVTTIENYAFNSCTALTSINVESENPNYSSTDGVLFNKDKTTLIYCPAGKTGEYVVPNSVTTIGGGAFSFCTALTSITIPNSVTTIGGGAFVGCTALTSITIPNSVTTIEYRAFSSCTALTSITIPNSVTTIENNTFDHCTALTSITIPNSITTIGDYAFAYCSALTSITNLNPVPVEISFFVFNGVNQSECTLEVPMTSISVYQNAEVWKEFNIVGIEVGIDEWKIENGELEIYPNPTGGELKIATSEYPISDIRIYDVVGKLVVQSKIVQSEIEINISHLPTGIYFVRIQTENGVVTRKVVKM